MTETNPNLLDTSHVDFVGCMDAVKLIVQHVSMPDYIKKEIVFDLERLQELSAELTSVQRNVIEFHLRGHHSGTTTLTDSQYQDHLRRLHAAAFAYARTPTPETRTVLRNADLLS